jgi:pilus assembly protein CpaB
MRRSRTLILVLLIIIIGLVVAFVALRQFLTPQETEQQVLFVDVWYAGQNITQGSRITEDALATLSLPQDKVLEVMFTRDELPFLVDKIAKIDMEQGMLITEAMVTDSATSVDIEGPSWASVIPPGMTAMSIPVDRLSVSGYAINTGAHVNVNACMLFVDVDPSYQTILPNLTAILTGTGLTSPEGGLPVLSLGVSASGSAQGRLELDPSVQQPYYIVPSESQRPRTVCQAILQDVVVLRLGDFPLVEQAPAAEEATQEGDPNAQTPPPAVPDLITLIVTPQDSITLSYLIYTNAKLSMTLRNPSDQARLATEASTLQFLLSQYNIPVPAKLPYALHPALGTLTTPELTNDNQPAEEEQ